MESNIEATVPGEWGTRTYGIKLVKTVHLRGDPNNETGAPECCALTDTTKMRHNKVKRNIDIWSLGCIFSEAAVWAVKDRKGLRDYRDNRCSAVKLIHGLSPNDVFHDRENLLPAVEEQHDELGKKYGETDFITGNVVYSMVGRMLKSKPEFRPTAEELIDEGERAIKKARTHLSNYEGQSRTSLSVRTPRNPLGIKDPSSDLPAPHRSILNEQGRFVRSPNVTIDQLDGSADQEAAPRIDIDRPQFPRSKGKSRSSGSVSATTNTRQHNHNEAFQEPDSPELVASPISAPQSRNGDVRSEHAQSPPPKRNNDVPFCSIADAQNWYAQRKNGNVVVQLTKHGGLMSELNGRDHVSDTILIVQKTY